MRRTINLHLQSLATVLLCFVSLFTLQAFYFILRYPSTDYATEDYYRLKKIDWHFEQHHHQTPKNYIPNRQITLPVNCSNWEESKSCNNLWRGLPSLYNNMPTNVNISVIISYCNTDNDDSMRLFKDYVNQKYITVKDVTIIHRCPGKLNANVDFSKNVTIVPLDEEERIYTYPHTSFAKWLSKYNAPVKKLSNYNHIVLFLSSESIKKMHKRRSIQQVIQATLQYGFGCILKPLEYTQSIYHNTAILRTFRSQQNNEERSFGHWLDDIGISMINEQKLTPVCYSDSFAIKASDIPSKRNMFLGITKDLEFYKNSTSEINEFVERSMADIFTYPLEKNLELYLINHADGVEEKTCCFTGMLRSKYIKPVPPIWKGDSLQQDIDISKLRISLVLSYCDEDMTWIKKYINNVKIEQTTIYSKCNSTIQDISTMPFGNVTITELPNVGRCDHSYAHYMHHLKKSEANDNHIILFLKASRILHQTDSHARTIHDMIRIAFFNGLGCGIELSSIYSIYYYTRDVRIFQKKHYKGRNIASAYRNFGAWLDELGMELPSPLVPICYSGFFAIKASRIWGLHEVWKKMEDSLSRGNDIEEGHFAERTWAALLMNPLTSSQVEELEDTATGKTPSYIHYIGSLNSVDF